MDQQSGIAIIIQKLKAENDSIGLNLLSDVLKAAILYVKTVSIMETALMCSLLDGQELNKLRHELDTQRTVSHNALIDAINICTRYILSHYQGKIKDGIYPDPIHLLNKDRRAIGDWAGRLVGEVFLHRK